MAATKVPTPQRSALNLCPDFETLDVCCPCHSCKSLLLLAEQDKQPECRLTIRHQDAPLPVCQKGYVGPFCCSASLNAFLCCTVYMARKFDIACVDSQLNSGLGIGGKQMVVVVVVGRID